MVKPRVERLLPWGGAVAGAGWVLGNFAPTIERPGAPDSLDALAEGGTRLLIAQQGYALMGIGLVVLSVAVRARLRAGENDESTYSGLAYAGLVVAASASLARLALIQVAAAAADEDDRAVAHVWTYLDYYAWWPILISVSIAILACGVGGTRTLQLPRWYCRASVVLGALGVLGGLNVPPGGLLVYLLLPIWLLATSIVLHLRLDHQALV